MTKEQRYDLFSETFEERDGFRAKYRGRYFYDGPALDIESDELQDVIRAYPERLQWDQLGRGLIVYPT
jgi:hypothetical protein